MSNERRRTRALLVTVAALGILTVAVLIGNDVARADFTPQFTLCLTTG